MAEQYMCRHIEEWMDPSEQRFREARLIVVSEKTGSGSELIVVPDPDRQFEVGAVYDLTFTKVAR